MPLVCHCAICLLRSLTPSQTSDTLLFLVCLELELSNYSISLSLLCTHFHFCIPSFSFSQFFCSPVVFCSSHNIFYLHFSPFVTTPCYRCLLKLEQAKDFADLYSKNFSFDCKKGKMYYLCIFFFLLCYLPNGFWIHFNIYHHSYV